ncbi:MAG TPA: EF-Tu/IF-2/RF-3 family GTPase [Solirubrobacteraceae bacterium]|nr:EF-Tu/IF-2/RF-3 family GTPase [Solirubrobacteraceae bacterium]
MFRLTIEDVFFIRGRGSVVTGKIEAGTVHTGDEALIDGNGPVRVDGIEAFRKVLDQASAGENVGLLFSTLEKSQLRRGAVVSSAGDAAPPAEPRAPETPVTPGGDPRFAQVHAQRAQFLEMHTAGLMTEEQIDESLRALTFAADHRQWLMKARTDDWYSSVDGTEWRPDTPPA